MSSLFSGLLELVSPALCNLTYKDSRGQMFAIFSFASGSFSALDADGKELALVRGRKIAIVLFISTASPVDSKRHREAPLVRSF